MIEISHLAKRFGALHAVQDLSLQLHPGEILGFLGPNGAGKSTTMKMITGFLQPDQGEVLIHGLDVTSEPIAAQKLIGYLPEGAPLYEEMQVQAFLMFIAEIRGFTGHEKLAVVNQAVEKMALSSVLDQRIETLSKGFKRRVGLAQAILHDPKVLVLDEPTDGLDPNQKHQVRNLIQSLSRDKIVIISTHILEEVTAVCTRAVIMSDGRLLEDCAPEKLEQRSRYHRVISLELQEAPSDSLLKSLQALADLEVDTSRLRLYPKDSEPLFAEVLKLCEREGAEVRDIYQERGRLDDVFREITLGAAA